MRSTGARGLRALLAAGVGVLVPLAGCLQNEGVDPAYAELNFPIAIRLVDATDDASSAPTHLLVANSNFDLSFNAATVQSYDLAALDAQLTTTCATSVQTGQECAVVPEESGERAGLRGNVLVVPGTGLLTSEVRIGSYAEGLAVSPSRRRVYLPVRSQEDVTWLELGTDGTLSCGGNTTGTHVCDAQHRSTDRTVARSRGVSLPNEPLDVHVGSLTDFGLPASAGDYLAMAHRAGSLSFFHVPGGTDRPVLTDVLSGGSLTLVTVAFEPATRRFWTPTGNGALVLRSSVSLDASSTTPTDAVLLRAPSVTIGDLDVGTSSASIRQVHIDPRGGLNQGRFYAVASRPASLLVGRVDPATNQMIHDAVLPLGSQPNRAAFAELDGRMIAFVSCYLGREVYVYDVDQARLLTILRGASGPFEMAVDTVTERLYLTDFRISVIRVFDLAPMIDCFELTSTPATAPDCAPRALGMLGIPSTVQELR